MFRQSKQESEYMLHSSMAEATPTQAASSTSLFIIFFFGERDEAVCVAFLGGPSSL
jgi:hypothetical protein